jgi:aspartate/methionine/tyrosine aminotransferase
MKLLSTLSKFARNPVDEDNLEAELLMKKGKNVIQLNRGDPTFYFHTPKYIVDAYIRALKDGHTNYSSGIGIEELRTAVSKRYKRLYNVRIHPDNIITTQATSEAIMFVNMALVEKGDRAILFKPYYPFYPPNLKLFGGESIIEEYDEKSGWNIDTQSLERSVRQDMGGGRRAKYIMITNPNNPTGTVLGRKTLEEIVDIANNYGITLISDEIYDEIIYNNAKFTSIANVAKGVPHIILNGAAKDFDATGFKVGFIIIPGEDRISLEIRRRLVKLATLRICPNTPAQYAMVEGINNVTEHKRALRAMVKGIERRSNMVVRTLNDTPYFDAVRPNSAFYVFPRINFGMLKLKTDREFVERLLIEKGVQIVRGSVFGSPSHVRIVALADERTITKALTNINEFCKKYSR